MYVSYYIESMCTQFTIFQCEFEPSFNVVGLHTNTKQYVEQWNVKYICDYIYILCQNSNYKNILA